MKTDRRHELQTNWLADHLGQWVEKLKPYTNHLLTGGLLLAAVIVGWFALGWIWKADDEKSWQQFNEKLNTVNLNAEIQESNKVFGDQITGIDSQLLNLRNSNQKNPSDETTQKIAELEEKKSTLQNEMRNKQTELRDNFRLERLKWAKANLGTTAGQAAALAVAIDDSSTGKQTILSNPTAARKVLDDAAALLEQLKKHTGSDRLMRHRTQFELAQVYETRMATGSLDDKQQALREYQDLVKQGAFCKEQAERRIKSLQDSKNQDYDVFLSEIPAATEKGSDDK